MTEAECRKMEEIAELKVRRFFDHFLSEVLPKVITAHNQDVTAHKIQIRGAVEAGSMRVKLWVLGGAFTGGLGLGGLLVKLLV